MIRVLHVITTTARGGLETVLMNYYRNIDRSKVQFDFLKHRSENEAFDDEIEKLGGKIFKLPYLNPFNPNYLRSLNRFFAEHPEYKIVHVHQDCMSSVILKAAKNNGVPIRIAHSHSSSQDKNIKYPIKLFYRKQITKYATDLFACSNEAGKWMFRGAPFKVLNNVIDTRLYKYSKELSNITRNALNIPKDSFVVGHIGRFAPVKNHSFLIDVFYEIKKKHQNSVLLLVGEGKLQKDIKSKVESLRLSDSVIFNGISENVPKLLNAMDVFIMPSLYEGLPVSLLEAQANGLPCIICNHFSQACNITENIYRLPLDNNPALWAELALKLRNNNRIDTIMAIKSAGLDVGSKTEWLQNYYLEQMKALCR